MAEVSRHAITAATSANLIELVMQVMTQLGNSDVSSSLGGVIVTPEHVATMVSSEIQSTFRGVLGDTTC
mgnify:CR=1 FL=1